MACRRPCSESFSRVTKPRCVTRLDSRVDATCHIASPRAIATIKSVRPPPVASSTTTTVSTTVVLHVPVHVVGIPSSQAKKCPEPNTRISSQIRSDRIPQFLQELEMPKRKRSKEGGNDGRGGTKEKKEPVVAAAAGVDDGAKWSKSKKKRMRAKLAKQRKDQQQRSGSQQKQQKRRESANDDSRLQTEDRKQKRNNDESSKRAGREKESRQINTSMKAKSALQQSFLARLSGSRFRELNEDLYTTTSDEAYKKFTDNPDLFDQYHEGFRKQVSQWPVNPVDVILRWVQKKGEQSSNKKLVVADFGCGDAKLAKLLSSGVSRGKVSGDEAKSKTKSSKQTAKSCNTSSGMSQYEVHSFDLVSNGNPLITPCDMANLPLEDDTVDIGVFCLALMGTNIADFIREAHRVLRHDGVLKIAEVRSRFEATAAEGENQQGSGGGGGGGGRSYRKRTDDRLLNDFVDTMLELGFECTQKDRSNKMFILMEFCKTGEDPSKDATFTAKPCIYKRR